MKTVATRRVLLGLGFVVIAAAAAHLVDASLTAATLVVLIAVLFAARLGLLPGILAALGGFLILNYWFTPPRHTLDIEKSDDVIALIAFLGAAAVVSWIVTRLEHLRRTAERREREAGVRLDLTNRVLAGETPRAVAERAVAVLVPLFGLSGCRFRIGTEDVSVGTVDAAASGAITAEAGGVWIVATPRAHTLSTEDRAVLEALLTGLATAIDRVRLEDKAREAEVAAEVDRTRTGFLTAVTHNLRTPLASIRAASSTLLAPDTRLDDGDRRELLDTIYTESDRLERQVAKILAVSRIRGGGLEPERSSVDLVESAQVALRRLRPLGSGHALALDIAPDVPDLFLDPAMVDQVLLNLLENALAYAPSGSPIEITGRRSGDVVEMRVVDHGPGIDPADRERIFGEFVRASGRPETEGTGLGLAIVRAVVELHGGRVRVEDTPGGRCHLRGRVARCAPAAGRMSVATVLLVEDDNALRRALRMSFRGRDFDVLEVATGEAALNVLAEQQPDAIVLDLGLPGIDGFETLRRLRTYSQAPVIVLTARDNQRDKVEALDAGADDYVTKPFDPEELLARVRAALRRVAPAQTGPSLLRFKGLEVDLESRAVRRDGDPVHLTKTELELLEQLVRHPGKLLTHQFLLREVWGPGYGSESNYLRVYVRQLRRKLGDDAAQPRFILTESGIGYRWIAELE